MGRWWWLFVLVVALAIGARVAGVPVAGAACPAGVLDHCQEGTMTGTSGGGTSNPGSSEGSPFVLTVTANPATPAAGQGATFTLVVSVRRAVTVTYVTTQQYDFSLAPAGGKPVWLWSAGHLFGQIVYSVSLAAGHTLTFSIHWNGQDAAGHPLPAGTYQLTGVYRGLVGGAPTVATATLTIH